MARKRRARKRNVRFKLLLRAALFVLKIPFYIIRGVQYIIRKSKKEVVSTAVRRKRKQMPLRFKDLGVVQTDSGEYAKTRDSLFTSDSTIGIILGARGTGKSALGLRLLENVHSKTKRACFAMGFSESELPSWIKAVEDTSKISNNSFVLIDEGGILFSSRKSMSSANTLLSNLLLIARHKNMSILFISQNSSNLEINVLRQADFLLLKPSSLLQKDFERKIVKKIYDGAAKGFEKFSSKKGLTYVYSDLFRGFVTNNLPSFWGERLGKSFR